MQLYRILFIAVITSCALEAASCFDFNQPISKLRREPIALNKSGAVTKKGKVDEKIDWTAAREIVDIPIQKVLNHFLNPQVMRNKENTSVKKVPIESKHYYDLRKIEVTVDATFFMNIE